MSHSPTEVVSALLEQITASRWSELAPTYRGIGPAPANLLLVRARNDRITESRDYLDQVASAGRLPELLAAAQSAVSPARS
ncbi:hypothetical protein [Amycolatopsis methanolica]|uniref:hypothetical protein n=1 Tax=Amycolatopsis methanolica TaxID=1814 RepID=UPI00342014EA